MNDRGLFVTFEGMDGSGKTTQLNHLAAHLSSQAIPFIKTCEPGGTKFGKDVRTLLTTKRDASLSAFSEALLIYAARQNHVHTVIKPELNAGCWVLCDRFIDSTFAYQFFETDLDKKLFKYLNNIAVGENMPNRTYIFDINPGVAKNRRASRKTSVFNEDPAEASRNFDRIRRGFLKGYANDKTRCVLIDANLDETAISTVIYEDIATLNITGGNPSH